MAQLINCPQCRRRVNVPDVLHGQPVKCPGCGSLFTAGVDAEPPVWPDPAPPPPHPPPVASAPVTAPVAVAPADEDDDWYEEPRYRRRDVLPHRGGMVLALGILSLVSYVLVSACPFFAIAPVILGPLAWVMGHNDLRAIREGRMDPDGEGTTRAGYICGIIATVLFLISLAGVATLIILLVVTGQPLGIDFRRTSFFTQVSWRQ